MKALIDRLMTVPLWQKALGVGVIVVVMVGAFYFMIYTEKVEEIERLNGKIEELVKKINKAKEMSEKLEQFRKEHFLLKRRLDLTIGILPNKEEMDRLIIATEGLATQSGLQVLAFNPKPPRSKGFYGETPIDIQVIGGYHDLGYFFEKIANESRIINISGINMNVIGLKGQKRSAIKAKFTATAFWFQESNV
ncbi:type 4a pilus biogenesis protein PilO [candidate division CSSED10-310 bacterium]|uniref:Type 4a pilus biogenesis protein PilO n=1 Tax=candidate division CSSED10-310 bacterium TaxID=2855610 RepID=A0ABV6Z2M9_UNCC1